MYEAARVHRGSRRRGGVADGGAGVSSRNKVEQQYCSKTIEDQRHQT
jgi:hypothetical protein